MKEFVLTQPYATIEEMLSSGEVAVYKEELEQGNIKKYAIVSRIGNRYDLCGNKIENFVDNPFYNTQHLDRSEEDIEEKNAEEKNMKYLEIEEMIDDEIQSAIESALADAEVKHEQEICKLEEAHAIELAKVRESVKVELLAKLNA